MFCIIVFWKRRDPGGSNMCLQRNWDIYYFKLHLTTKKVLKVFSSSERDESVHSNSDKTQVADVLSGPLDWITRSNNSHVWLTLMHLLSYSCKILFYKGKTSALFCITSVPGLISSLMPDVAYSRSLTWHLLELYLQCSQARKHNQTKLAAVVTFRSHGPCVRLRRSLSKTEKCICEVNEYV